jgi:hypothetical protein
VDGGEGMSDLKATIRAQRLARQIADALDDRKFVIALSDTDLAEVAGDRHVDALITEFGREWQEAKR